MAKRLELLHELLPSASVFAVLINPANTASTEVVTRNLKDAARSLGLQLHFLRASTAAEIDAAFEGLAVSRADALIVSTDPFSPVEKIRSSRLRPDRRSPPPTTGESSSWRAA